MEKEYKCKPLYELIKKISRNSPNDHKIIENVLGINLDLERENIFRRYLAKNIILNEIPFNLVDYRGDSVLDRMANAGPYLRLTVGDACLSRHEILSHFHKLELAGAPSGNSLDDEVYYSQKTRWGNLGFGFLVRSPDCLRTLDFRFDYSDTPDGSRLRTH